VEPEKIGRKHLSTKRTCPFTLNLGGVLRYSPQTANVLGSHLRWRFFRTARRFFNDNFKVLDGQSRREAFGLKSSFTRRTKNAFVSWNQRFKIAAKENGTVATKQYEGKRNRKQF